MVGFGVGLGDVSEVCANDGNATRVAVTTAMSELGKVFIRSHSFRDRLAASSRTSLERRPQKPKTESEKAETGSSGHSQIPSWRSWVVARRAQLRFAAGLAGLGCKIRPRRICPLARIRSARLKAKSPTATSHSG